MKTTLVIFLLLLSSCTAAQRGKISALGNSAHIKCYSGNIVIYDGFSTGKVSSEENSDGYYFVEKGSGHIKEVSGNCDITYK